MYNTILVPTDGSDTATNAANHAIELAVEHDASVHVIHCVEPLPLGRMPAGTRAAGADHEEVLDRLKEAGEQAINTISTQATEAGVEVADAVVFGDAASEIVEYAEDEGMDLIVMGSTGRTGATRVMLGSVAEKVVRHSPIPVLTIRSG